MKVTTLALLLLLAGLSGFALSGLAGATTAWAGSCSHCVFDDEPPTQPTPKRANLA
jgi:hypothetical protein